MATVETTRTSRHNYVSTEPSPLVGRLGPWQLVRLMAEGNFTRVYQARPAEDAESGGESESPHRPAAYVLKVLRKEWWRDPAAIEMQRREAWVGSQVSHPNLLPVLSASVQEPPFYVVTPLLNGRALSQILTEQGPLVVPLALWIARQVAEGLDALFAGARLIHADVKPANILVSSSGHATLIDFGFAQTPAEASAWATRPLVGTLAYIGAGDADVHACGRSAKRHLQPGRDAVRNAHRPPAVGQRRSGRTGHAASRSETGRHPYSAAGCAGIGRRTGPFDVVEGFATATGQCARTRVPARTAGDRVLFLAVISGDGGSARRAQGPRASINVTVAGSGTSTSWPRISPPPWSAVWTLKYIKRAI